nr:MAG TPA: hypothetical protein [Bacteriophage sp.]DAZ58388.1 MAG TPA: hypothetical protein [Caudoviricetes sp.]DAZ72895.1 MAG TPA: hypothetical protein [Caudoviricetes sp.]
MYSYSSQLYILYFEGMSHDCPLFYLFYKISINYFQL